MDYKMFRERCVDRFPKSNGVAIQTVCSQIERVFSQGDYLNKRLYKEVFFVDRSKLAKSQFYFIRNILVEFAIWLRDNDMVDDSYVDYVRSIKRSEIECSEELLAGYFSDLDSALDLVSAVGRRVRKTDGDNTAQLRMIVILAWFGLSRSEMIQIRKKDVNRETKTVSVQDGRAVYIPSPYFEMIDAEVGAIEYAGFPVGQKRAYLPSKYLFRSARSDSLNEGQLTQLVKVFNTCANDYVLRNLSIVALNKNGRFYHMMQREAQGEDVLNAPDSEVYKMWKLLYRGEGGGG